MIVTVRDVLEGYTGKPIILFLRDGNSTTIHEIESIDSLEIDILGRRIRYKHVSKFNKVIHIELSV